MSNSPNELALALLAVLEAQAKKKGRKSLVKQVIGQLRKVGADEALVGQVSALGAETSPEPTVAAKATKAAKPAKSVTKPNTKAARLAASA